MGSPIMYNTDRVVEPIWLMSGSDQGMWMTRGVEESTVNNAHALTGCLLG